jgi:hypothetical protein
MNRVLRYCAKVKHTFSVMILYSVIIIVEMQGISRFTTVAVTAGGGEGRGGRGGEGGDRNHHAFSPYGDM